MDLRRAHQASLIRQYLQRLKDLGIQDLPNEDEAMKLHEVLTVVLHYFGFILEQTGGIGELQGNTKKDCDAWSERTSAAILDATADVDAFAKQLHVASDVIHDLRKVIEGKKEKRGKGA